MKRYCVCGYGWDGVDLDYALKHGDYFDSLDDAKDKYDWLWDCVLQPDEGALIYDVVDNKMIVED